MPSKKIKADAKDVCAACTLKVEQQDDAILCDECGRWEHLRCSTVDADTYNWLKEYSAPQLVFLCTRCLQALQKRRRLIKKASPVNPGVIQTDDSDASDVDGLEGATDAQPF